MRLKKWTIVGGAVTVVAVIAVFAVVLTPPLRVFRTTASMIAVAQGTNSISHGPEYDYALLNGADLVSLALGAEANSNQVFAMEIDCGSDVATLLVFDISNSNTTTIATSTSINTVRQQGLKSHFVNSERFVAQFDVNSVGDLVGGFLTVAGRLNLDTNGCPHAVLIALDRDTHDSQLGDQDTGVNTEQDAKSKDPALRTLRAGRAHFTGVLNVSSGGETNTVLIPFGHMIFRKQLDELSPG